MNRQALVALAVWPMFLATALAQASSPGSSQPGSPSPGADGTGKPGVNTPGAPGPPMGMGMPGGSSPQKKEKDLKAMTLEELLQKALQDNPDLRVAESKLREAEAELNRTRLQVLQKVARIHQEIALARAVVKDAETQLARINALGNAVAQAEKEQARFTLERTKAELAKYEAELPYLLGRQPMAVTGVTWSDMVQQVRIYGTVDDRAFRGAVSPGEKSVPASLADKVKKALDKPITVEFSDAPVRDVIDYLRDHLKGVNLHVTAKLQDKDKVTLKLSEPIPVGAVLQWLEDEFGLRCVLRDYGIVIAQQNAFPPGAQPLIDSWKKSKAVESPGK